MRSLLVLALFLWVFPARAADPDAAVQQRQQIFAQMQTALEALQANSKLDPLAHKAELAEGAQHLSDLSGQPFTLFGPDTTVTRRNTRASPMIQADPGGFRTATQTFTAAVQTLNATLLTKKDADAAVLQKQVSDVNAACQSCHTSYLR